MTTEERLNGICQMIQEERYNDDPDFAMTWYTEPPGQNGPRARAAITLGPDGEGDHVVLYWDDERGMIDVQVTVMPEWHHRSGAVTQMTILAPANPMGDFQVAEALEAVL